MKLLPRLPCFGAHVGADCVAQFLRGGAGQPRQNDNCVGGASRVQHQSRNATRPFEGSLCYVDVLDASKRDDGVYLRPDSACDMKLIRRQRPSPRCPASPRRNYQRPKCQDACHHDERPTLPSQPILQHNASADPNRHYQDCWNERADMQHGPLTGFEGGQRD